MIEGIPALQVPFSNPAKDARRFANVYTGTVRDVELGKRDVDLLLAAPILGSIAVSSSSTPNPAPLEHLPEVEAAPEPTEQPGQNRSCVSQRRSLNVLRLMRKF